MAVNARINSSGNIGQVKLTQQTRSTIAAQNFAPKPNVSLTELNDISITSVQNGQVVQYNSTTGKFEANTVSATVVSIDGGRF
jgi:hypothetical protein